MVVFGAPVAGGCGPGPARLVRQYVAIPAYWSPDVEPGSSLFRRLAQTGQATGIVVVNGSYNAPEKPYNESWAVTIRALSDAGIRVLGYVDTGYLGTSGHLTRADGAGTGAGSRDAWTAQIRRDIEDWYTLYGTAGLGGIFLDQTTSSCEQVPAYRSTVEEAHRWQPGGRVAMNPGRSVESCYAGVADTLVTFEGDYDQYLRRTAPAWERAGRADRFWHLVYGVPDERSMLRVVSLSKQRNAGYVYVTNDTMSVDGREHPWDTLPPEPYWRSELSTVYGPGLVLPSG
jgi:hypothetical protein